MSSPSHAETFDAILDEQPGDWAFFEVRVTLDDALRLTEARVALARANARPQFGPADHDFAITVANTHGHGARTGVVRSALRTLDMLGIRNFIAAFVVVLLVAATIRQLFNRS